LIVNDDGIRSPGLLAAKRAVEGLGDLVVAAPRDQQTGTSRSVTRRVPIVVSDYVLEDGSMAYMVEGTPADSVEIAIRALTKGKPDMVVCGINYGENLGSMITKSGTIGAAIEAACYGVPSLAVSVEVPAAEYREYAQIDFSASMSITRKLSEFVLEEGLPEGIDILKVDLPDTADRTTPFEITRVSRERNTVNRILEEEAGQGKRLYQFVHEGFTPDSDPNTDIYVLRGGHRISISPITLNLSAKLRNNELRYLEGKLRSRLT